MVITVGVLALQGAFQEHLVLLKRAYQELLATHILAEKPISLGFCEVRTARELSSCDALIIPGGESTTIALIAARSNLLDPLRDFVKLHRKPTWGTCAGLILLAESANRTKKGGQDLIGGLDVRVNRNHFGRQVESFVTDLDLPFLRDTIPNHDWEEAMQPFRGIFIRAPIVEKILPNVEKEQISEEQIPDTIVAPSREILDPVIKRALSKEVQVLGRVAKRKHENIDETDEGDIIAVQQGTVFGTSFHPELTNDTRIHQWWLSQVIEVYSATLLRL